MKKIWLLIIIITSLFLFGCGQTILKENTSQIPTSIVVKDQNYSQLQSKVIADKIRIILFHGTNRCYSCNKMEELLKKTLEENFKSERENKKISFQEINWELSENNAIVEKYQAWWLSVFITSITNWQENIQQETTAWRLMSNETAFKEYMTKRITTLFGKS
jgi:thioredoxin-related protein